MRRLLAGLLGVAVSAVWAVPAHADATRDKQWNLGFLKISDAWRLSQGDGVTVAVIDTGVDAAHPDLTGNILPGIDYMQSGANGLSDTIGHGTSMAGLIAAHGRGDAGIVGVAPKAKVLSVHSSNGTPFQPARDFAAGIRWGVQQGAKVISFSIGMQDTLVLESAVKEALAANVVFVAAIGNVETGRETGDFPARYKGVIGVAGVDQNGNHAAISVVDQGAVLAAPAVDIWSTAPGGQYKSATGTSNAAAIVAGAAALVRSKYPQMSATQVYDLLTSTAIDKGAPGRDSEFGFGIVDPVAALKKGPTGSSPSVSASAEGAGSQSSSSADGSDGSGAGHTVLIVVLAGGVVLLLLGGVVIAVVRMGRRPTGL